MERDKNKHSNWYKTQNLWTEEMEALWWTCQHTDIETGREGREMTDIDLILDKVHMNLDVFNPLMLNRICWHVYGTNIGTGDNSSKTIWEMNLS